MAKTVAYLTEPGADTCPHAVKQAERAASALAQSEAICRAHGVRLTPIRRKVLEALYSTHKPLGAYDLVDVLAQDGRRLAPITVYRALEFLMEQGLAHRLASQNAYIATLHGDSAHETTVFLVCETCGGVDEVFSSPLTDTLAGLLNGQGFQARTKVLEVVGRCAHCRDLG